MISIIIAAGKQSRFKSDVPKALAKLDNGEVLAVHNYNMLKRLGDVYIAVSDENKVYFKEYFNDSTLICVGKPGYGSGDAVYKALGELMPNEHVVICWGDVYITERHLEVLSNSPKIKGITIPVREEINPYVCISKYRVLFSKYGDKMPAKGLHDLSMFIVDPFSITLFSKLFRTKFFKDDMYCTEHGNEFEFLDLINFTPIDVELDIVDNIDDYSFNTLDEFTNISKMI